MTGPAGVAERLLLLLHYGIDWSDGWVAGYRITYWDAILPDRVTVATFRHATLTRWWGDVSAALQSRPRNGAERSELAALLATRDPLPVLESLREEVTALVLRVRIVAETVRAARATPGDPT